MMNILIPIAFIIILGALAAAGYFMLRSPGEEDEKTTDVDARKKRMARALALRIGVSVFVFLCVLLAWSMGWISPTGIRAGR